MESAERNGLLFRRELLSADRFKDAAIRSGSRNVKTPLARLSASLCSVTCRDQRRPFRAVPLRRGPWRLRPALLLDPAVFLAIAPPRANGYPCALTRRRKSCSGDLRRPPAALSKAVAPGNPRPGRRTPMKAQSSARASDAAAANEPVVLRENVGNIAVLMLNRPQARNSLSEAMLEALS